MFPRLYKIAASPKNESQKFHGRNFRERESEGTLTEGGEKTSEDECSAKGSRKNECLSRNLKYRRTICHVPYLYVGT